MDTAIDFLSEVRRALGQDPDTARRRIISLARLEMGRDITGPSLGLTTHRARSTSVLAAEDIAVKAGTLRSRVLGWIAVCDEGAADVEIQRALDMAANTERPRRVELLRGGFIVDSGRTVMIDGREHIRWEATELGMATTLEHWGQE